MKKTLFYTVLIAVPVSVVIFFIFTGNSPNIRDHNNENDMKNTEQIYLPSPEHEGKSFEEILNERRSERNFTDESLSKYELSQLLWAGRGVTDEERGFKTAPSAGATYPLDILVDVRNVRDLSPGIYRYDPYEHRLDMKKHGSERDAIYQASLNQESIKTAPVLFIMIGTYERITPRYGERGVRYTHIEAGHISQNIYLQATSMELGTVAIGAFEDETIKEILGTDAEPIYLMPVGRIEI